MAKRAEPASEAAIKRAVDLHDACGNSSEVARILGRPRQTVEGWIRQAKERGIVADGAVVVSEHEREKLVLKDKIQDLEKQLRIARREVSSTAETSAFFGEVRDALGDPPDWVVSHDKKTGHLGTPLAFWSDWHLCEVVKPEQVAFINQYDSAIAERRVRTLVEKTIHLCFDYHEEPGYPGIVVCLGGDIFSGFIHQELRETNDGTLAEQLVFAHRLILWGLLTLADRFKRVFVPGVVGNHGRLTPKPMAKNRVTENLEWGLYRLLEESLSNDDRFSFYVSDDTEAMFTVAGHRFLMTHGDSTGARGGDGIIGAIGPIVRGEKRVRDVQAMIDSPYDTALMGHYHQKVSLDNVIVNPTLKGYDEYAKNMLRARPEPPAQMLIFVHPEYGIIDEKRVFVEPVRKAGRTIEFVSWPKK